MPFITLAVKMPVVEHVRNTNNRSRQLAIQDASPDLQEMIRDANADNRMSVQINGVFELSIGDNSAIWVSHQSQGLQYEDFGSLYELLARRPDVPVKFTWNDHE